jgi:outer membrane cobalamin receptor
MLLRRLAQRTVVLLFLTTSVLHAQNLDSLLKVSAFSKESDLQKQLNQTAGVGAGKALTTRETPGILSIISADDIRKMGVRDIMDILRTVPGFDIAQDLQFVTGISFRGNWANEGKVLFLLDGQQINELLYQTVPLLNNLPIDAIEKIEIIRGPGSAIYGGSAEYSVINIITKQASSANGIAAYGTAGLHANAIGRTNGGVFIAQHGNESAWDLGFFQGKGIVSDQRNYIDPIQNSDSVAYPVSNLGDVTSANPVNVNGGFRWKGLQARAMYNGYKTNDPVFFSKYDNYSADVRYTVKISEKLSLTPQYTYMNQVPWAYGNIGDGSYILRSRATRNLFNLTGNYNLTRKINIVAGALYFADKANDLLPANLYFGGQDFNLYNYAAFAQGLFKHRVANLTVGARYEKNNRAGDAFVPRLALTKKIENFHFKVLYSQAFRSPALENLHLSFGGNMVPEKSSITEVELGYQFTPEMLFSVNAFVINTNNVIIFEFVTNDQQGYRNFSKSGSSGIEAVYSIRKKKWNAQVNYSYAKANSSSTVANYKVPQTSAQFAGMPSHKVVGSLTYLLISRLSLNTTWIYSSRRFAYTAKDTNDNPIASQLDPYLLMNCFFNYDAGRFTLGAGAYDLLNQKPAIPQAYNGNYAPVPGRSREWVLKISYQLNFKKN